MNMRDNMSRSREVLDAYWRQGLRELGGAFYGPGTVAQHPEYGMPGTRPPGLVSAGLNPEVEASQSRDDHGPSVLDERLRQAEVSQEPREPEPPQLERE